MWKAILASVGAAVGPFVGGLAGYSLLHPASASSPRVFWLGLPPVWYFVAPIGGALLALLGFGLGSSLDGRSGRGDGTQKWKAVFHALGAAIGPVIGFHAVAHLILWHARLSGRGNEWSGLGAIAGGMVAGVPIGGVLFCLMGLYLGAAVDRRIRNRDAARIGKLGY